MSESSPASPEPDRLSISRMYDAALGGQRTFAGERAYLAELKSQFPGLVHAVAAHRAVLRRAVRWLAGEAGIRQFLDVGAGIPNDPNVHEIAQEFQPDARVVYVDRDEAAVRGMRYHLHKKKQQNAVAVQADARDVGVVLREAGALLDFGQPVAVLLFAVLHFLPDADDPAGIVEALAGAAQGGGYLALTHLTAVSDEQVAALDRASQVTTPTILRPREEILALYGDRPLVEPGLVWFDEWHPDADVDPRHPPEAGLGFAGVAQLRGRSAEPAADAVAT